MSNKVTYTEIIEALSAKTGFSKQKSELFAKALIKRVKQELEENGKASITNFGSFKVKEVAERQGQNPQTGEPITIPAHKRVSFTPYKALKEEVNAKYAHLETELIGEKEDKKEQEPVKPAPAVEESEPKIEQPLARADKKERSPMGANTGLITVGILTLVVVAIASIWFLMRPGEEDAASEETAIEQQQTPESVSQRPGETDSEEAAEESETNEPESEPMQNTNTEDRGQMEREEVSDHEIYTVQPDEWYWTISKKVYGNSQFWPLIFQQNFTANHHPDSLEKNVRLEVPALQGSIGNPTVEDYRRLAEAASVVSKAYQNFGRTDKAEEYARFAKKWKNLGR